MKVRIGINGFGRIGRLILRESFLRDDVEIVGINDLMEVDHLAYLLKYDSVHGRFKEDVRVENGNLVIRDQVIRVTSEMDPSKLKWNEVKAEIIADCTGIFKTIDKAKAHLDAGAQKVVISAPSADAPMFVMGVNDDQLKATDTIVSNASCTTNCLAPMVKVLHDKFTIIEGLMTTIHAVTASQYTVDGPSKKDYRAGRSALNNIIPASTGAAKAVGKVIPELEGKLTGMSMRVPTVDVSAVDLTVRLATETTYTEVMQAFQEASEGALKGILEVTKDEVVSQDFVSDTHTCVIDYKAGIALNSTFYKIIGWYDNEYGYAAKMIDLAVKMHRL